MKIFNYQEAKVWKAWFLGETIFNNDNLTVMLLAKGVKIDLSEP